MAATKPQVKKYDEAKLKSMVEPITVRIEKIRGAQRTPINLPPPEDPEAPQNGGLTQDDIRGLEQFLATQWSGGGFYEITATDSSQPTPITMVWQPYYDINLYPERKPPTPEEAAQGIAPIVQLPVNQRGPANIMTAFPNGFPNFNQQPVSQPMFTPYPPMPAPPQIGTNQWAVYSQEIEKRRHEDEVRALREENARRDREAQEAKHAAQLAAERSANETRTRALEAQLTELKNTIANLAKTGSKDPEIELLKQQAADARAQADRERAEREAERRNSEMLAMIKATQEATQRQIDESNRRTELLMQQLRESQNRGPDPMIALFTELTRNNAEAIKEISRNSKEQITQLQMQMLKPQDILAITTGANAAADANGAKIASAYSGVLDMQTKVMEQALQMAPQGSGVVDVVRDSVNGLKDFAERYVGAKSAEQRMAAQAQVQVAQAQAHVATVQAAAAAGAPIPGVVYTPPAPPEQGQLAGPSEEPRKKKAKTQAPAEVVVAADAGVKRRGRTDREWFGPAIEEAIMMREQVAMYIDSLRSDPPQTNPDGTHIGMSAEQAAQGIIMATSQVAQLGINVPAIIDLLMQQRYADFIDVLLPDAPPNYKIDVAQILTEHIARLSGEPSPSAVNDNADDGGDDDADDDDGDESDDDGDSEDRIEPKHPVKPKASFAPRAPVSAPTSAPSKPNQTRRA